MKHEKSHTENISMLDVESYNPQVRDGKKIYQILGRLFTLIMLICCTTVQQLHAQCTPAPAAVDSMRVLSTTCETTDEFIGLSGNFWEFTIDEGKNYSIKVCYDGDGSNYPQAELYDDAAAATLLGMSTTIDTDGCVTVDYTNSSSTCASADDKIYLAIYSHTCLADWEDWNVEVTCSCCTITCADDVHIPATNSTCTAPAFTIPVPTIGGPCDAASVSYSVNYPLIIAAGGGGGGSFGSGIIVSPAPPIDLSTVTELTVGAGLPVGVYTITWTVSDCAGNTYQCNQRVHVEPVMVCNDNVNITLTTSCEVAITADMILEAPCATDANYTVSVQGQTGNTIAGPGTYVVTVAYTPVGGMPTDPSWGISCWGEVTIEDKVGPLCTFGPDELEYNVSCGENTDTAMPTVSDCTGVDDINSYDLEYGNCGDIYDGSVLDTDGDSDLLDDLMAGYTAPDGTMIPAPTSAEVAQFTGADFVLDQVIKRNYQITDALGFTNSTCMQFIYIWRPGNDAVQDPAPQVVVECGTDTNIDSLALVNQTYVPHYANPLYGTDSDVVAGSGTNVDDNGNPEFLTLGGSHAACKFTVTSTDIPLEELCGDTRKFIREWTVLNWCTGAIIINQEPQVVKTVDTTPPDISGCPNIDPNGDGEFDDAEPGTTYDNPLILNTSSSSPNTCYFLGTLTAPITATDSCSGLGASTGGGSSTGGSTGSSADISYNATVFNAVANPSSGSGYTIGSQVAILSNLSTPVQLNVGTYHITYNAVDDCGNEAPCSIVYEVLDDDKPIAICDERTTVSLSDALGGNAQICADNLDSGSYDNCGIVDRKVQRMDVLGAVPFADCIEVTCEDSIVMVILRVFDAAGNFNECMVEVEVQDKIGPFLTCPPDITINCTDDLSDLNLTGNVDLNSTSALSAINGYAFDNCELGTVSHQDFGELDCGAGEITRQWKAESNGSIAICEQKITVTALNSFTVQFPKDTTITTCVAPNNLGDFGAPVITNDLCGTIGISPSDQTFTIVDDACYKIIRTWTVVNWCLYEQNSLSNTDLGNLVGDLTYTDDGDGYFKYTQTIKVQDSNAPTFLNCPTVPQNFASNTENCGGTISLAVAAMDDCSPLTALRYTWKVDLDNDGTFDDNGSGNQINNTYDGGSHTAYFTVTDGCGNFDECTVPFTIADDEAPNIACKPLSVELNPATGELEMWASDYINESGTSDFCSPFEMLEYRVRRVSDGDDDADPTTPPAESNITFTCNDLVENPTGVFNPTFVTLEVWVGDTLGNWDYCLASTLVTDNGNYCTSGNTGGTGGGSFASIAGRIMDEEGDDVEEVSVEVISDAGFYNPFITAGNGNYIFNSLPMYGNYTVEPTKDVDPLNGVTTFDLVLITKHILGTETLDSPYKMIAADINNDGKVTTADVIEGRRLILYIITDFTANTSWRFIDAEFNFPDNADPFTTTFPEILSIDDLEDDMMIGDFVAVKVGDVNSNAIPNSLLGSEERNDKEAIVLQANDEIIKAGEETTLEISVNDLEHLKGYQFTLSFDDNLEMIDLIPTEELGMYEANFGFTLLDEGIITTSYTKPANVEMNGNATLFTVRFKANQEVQLSDAISLSSRYTKAEAYDADLNLMDVAIQFGGLNNTQVANASFELYQNQPNPFTQQTTIGFNLPTNSTAQLSIYNMSGKVLRVIEGDYQRGYNEIVIEDANLTSGVLYYQLDTPTNSTTRKMIVID